MQVVVSRPEITLDPEYELTIVRDYSYCCKAKVKLRRGAKSFRAGYAPKKTRRLIVLSIVFLAWTSIVVYRLVELEGPGFEKWSRLASVQHSQTLQILGARGNILDRLGRKLAVSVESLSIGVRPNKVEQPEQVAEILAKALNRPPAQILAKLKTDVPFLWLERGVNPELRELIQGLDSRAFEIESNIQRSYPLGTLASPIIGRVNREGRGQAGIELAYEDKLGVDHEVVQLARDAKGRLARRNDQFEGVAEFDKNLERSDAGKSSETLGGLLESESIIKSLTAYLPPSEGRDDATISARDLRSQGEDVSLTLDAVIQEIFESELQKGQEDAMARQAFGVVLDSITGDILALGQSVRFDPNRLYDVSPADMKNVAVQNVFEPGSTFKPIVAAIGVEEGAVSPSELIDCENGNYYIGGHVIRDVHPSGLSNVHDILVHSSNICMAKIGHRIGADRLHRNLRILGFGESVDVGLPGVERGILRDPDDWREIDLATISFGQSVGVNTLQLAQAYGVIANGGVFVAPKLITDSKKEIRSPNRFVRRVLSERTAREISDALQGVVEDEDGTGAKAAISGITVYGKTGTAQKAKADSRGYDPDAVQASFVGFVRGTDYGLKKNLVMVVVIDEPSVKPRWGGVVAAPVFQRAMSRILSHLVATEGAGGKKDSV